MIVFNLVAVPVLLLVGALGAGLGWLAPAMFGGPYQELTYAVLAVGIGGLAELLGLRARLFFLPVWLIGGAVLAWQLTEIFGTTGLLVGLGLLALLLAAFVASIARMAVTTERDKEKRVEEARALLAEQKLDAAREKLAEAWVVPGLASTDAARAKHLLSVLDLAEPNAAGMKLPADALALARGCRALLSRVAAGGKPIAFSDSPATLLHAMGYALLDGPKYALKDADREELGKVAGEVA